MSDTPLARTVHFTSGPTWYEDELAIKRGINILVQTQLKVTGSNGGSHEEPQTALMANEKLAPTTQSS